MFNLLFITVILFSSLGESFAKNPIVIGSKKFTESIILGEILSIILEEKYQETVVRKFGLGGTKIAFDALVNEDIHTYPEYTGTGYVMILKQDGENDPKKVFNIVNQLFQKKWDIHWSPPIGFNNTYALAVKKDNPSFTSIHKLSQLQNAVDKYSYAAPYEFMERKDGHTRFSNFYQLNFNQKNIISMEAGLMYSAINEKKVDMVIVYSTDGRIKASQLKLLKDDKSFFPPYFASFLSKNSYLKKNPNLEKAQNLIGDLISESEMVEMNDHVDRLKEDPYQIAKNFLIYKEIISGVQRETKQKRNIFSYAWNKRNYLLQLLWQHVSISFMALSLGCLFSLPCGILVTRYKKLSKIIFPIINTIQTIPSVALLGFMIPLLGIGFLPTIIALFLYSLLPIIRNTYTGIKSVDKSYLESAKGIGLSHFQILLKIEIPLALPFILSGVRTAAVIVIGTATLAALIGAGGFGDPIFRGVSTINSNLILIGAIPSALLAIVVDKLLASLENILVSKGLRLVNES
jgi:osmoprotectant transport system permease protein